MKKSIGIFFALIGGGPLLHAQTNVVIRENISDYVYKIPVCQTPKASQTVCLNSGVCYGDRALEGFTAQFTAMEQKGIAPASASQQNAQEEMMKKMQDPAYVEKIKNMSIDEQMKLSQEMSAQASGATRPTSGVMNPLETKIFNENAKLAADEMQFSDKLNKELSKIFSDYDVKFAKLKKDMENEIKGCPMIDGGEGDGGPDPKCENPIRSSYGQKHIAMMNEMITAFNALLSSEKSQIKSRYAAIEALIVESSYGDNVKLQGPYNSLCGCQGYIESHVMQLSGATSKLFEYACNVQNYADQLIKN